MGDDRGQDWRDAIYEELVAAGVSQVAYVPDAGHTRLIEACHADPAITPVVLTTEEEGIGVLAGADLAGERGVLLMQSSGVGNCLNTFSLVRNCGFPIVTLVTMRGEWGEFQFRGRSPWARPRPQRSKRAGWWCQRADHPDECPARSSSMPCIWPSRAGRPWRCCCHSG